MRRRAAATRGSEIFSATADATGAGGTTSALRAAPPFVGNERSGSDPAVDVPPRRCCTAFCSCNLQSGSEAFLFWNSTSVGLVFGVARSAVTRFFGACSGGLIIAGRGGDGAHVFFSVAIFSRGKFPDVILLCNSSRTVSFIMAPQVGQMDNVGAKLRSHTGQFIRQKLAEFYVGFRNNVPKVKRWYQKSL